MSELYDDMTRAYEKITGKPYRRDLSYGDWVDEVPVDILADLINAQHQAADDEIDRKIYADAPDSIKARLRCFNNGSNA